MNTFKFIGTIPVSDKNKIVKTTNNGNKQLRFIIKQNENNSAYVQMFGDRLYNGCIPVYFINEGRKLIKFEDRNNLEIIKKAGKVSKYTINDGYNKNEFIWKDDFINYFSNMVNELPSNTIYEIDGEFEVSFYNNKSYNNFNIKSITVNNSARPEFKLKLDLFYNNNSLDETDKRNKFILNSYIEQYVYSTKRKEYFPIQVQFITNRFDFKNPAHIDIIKHRKSNMQPKKEEGFVKATWEAHYVKGAQLILPPLETLPKDIQFEIINAGRDISEYMSNVVGEADEFICLTRPDNTNNEDGIVYKSLDCTENEFKSKITQSAIEVFDNENSLDNIAKKEALENPFN